VSKTGLQANHDGEKSLLPSTTRFRKRLGFLVRGGLGWAILLAATTRQANSAPLPFQLIRSNVMPFDFALPSSLSLFTLRTALVRRKASGHSLLGATETDRADDCFFLRYPSPLFLPKTLISPRVLDTLLQQVAYLLLQCHLTILVFFPFFLTSYIIPCSPFSRFSSTLFPIILQASGERFRKRKKR
jgi:hypothetical protein